MQDYRIVNNQDDLLENLKIILSEAGLNLDDLDGKVTFSGMDPIRPTKLKVGSISAIVTGANSVASALIWQHRTGIGQDIHIDLRKAYVSQSAWQDTLIHATMINGTPQMIGGNVGQTGTHFLPTRDGRHVAMTSLYSSNSIAAMGVFNSGLLPSQLVQASRKRDADDLEQAAQRSGLPLAICRTRDEYHATEQYQFHKAAPLIHIEKIGESEPEPLHLGDRPLSGVRAVGMTHVVAGPTVLRQLSAQGADCLNLNMPNWVEEPTLYFQCQTGIRQAFMNPLERKPIYELVKDADVFVENLKPHLADSQGYSAETLAEYRPGIIYVCIKMNTPLGPWADWVGYDFTAAAMCGMFCDLGSSKQPETPNGVNVICDFLTGYLATIGVQAALLRRAKEGGSYKITVTLSQTIMLEQAIGLIDRNALLGLPDMDEDHKPLAPNLQSGDTPFGHFTRLGSQIDMSETPEYWADPMIVPIGSCKMEWKDR